MITDQEAKAVLGLMRQRCAEQFFKFTPANEGQKEFAETIRKSIMSIDLNPLAEGVVHALGKPA